jgi:hypothetical protein
MDVIAHQNAMGLDLCVCDCDARNCRVGVKVRNIQIQCPIESALFTIRIRFTLRLHVLNQLGSGQEGKGDFWHGVQLLLWVAVGHDVLVCTRLDPVIWKAGSGMVAAPLQPCAQFLQGDFPGPGHFHGHDIPGLAALKAAKPGQIAITDKDVKCGAELRYKTADP